jgi:hypothetical protein
MKNYLNLLLLSFIACLFATQQTKAQYYGDYDYITYSKHEVFVQYGAPTFQELSTQIRHTSLVARTGIHMNLRVSAIPEFLLSVIIITGLLT